MINEKLKEARLSYKVNTKRFVRKMRRFFAVFFLYFSVRLQITNFEGLVLGDRGQLPSRHTHCFMVKRTIKQANVFFSNRIFENTGFCYFSKILSLYFPQQARSGK